MKRSILIIIAFLSFVFGTVHAQDIEDQIANLKRQADALDKAYDRFKSKEFQERNRLKDEYSVINEKVESARTERNNLTEQVYILKENLARIEEQYQVIESEQIDFENKVLEAIDSEGKRLLNAFPYLLNRNLPKVNEMRSLSQSGNLQNTIQEFFVYKNNIVEEGESIEFGTSVYISDEDQSRFSATYVRAGFVHMSYYSDKQTAVLLRVPGLQGTTYEWESQVPGSTEDMVAEAVNKGLKNQGKDSMVDIPVDPAQSGKKLKSFIQESGGGFIAAIVTFFNDGGFIMYIMLPLLIFAIFIMIERGKFYWGNSVKRAHYVEGALTALKEQDKEKAKSVLEENNSVFSRILLSLLNSKQSSRDESERVMDERLIQEAPAFEKRLPTLAVIAAVAPLLGLLGTVTGMISLFDVITLYGTSNPKILAGGISIALVTTQAGLGLAIPIMMVHHMLVRTKTAIMNNIERFSIEALNIIYPEESGES